MEGAKEYLYEVAVNTLVAVVSGLNLLGDVPANGTQTNSRQRKRRLQQGVGAWLWILTRGRNKILSPDSERPFWELYD